METFISQNIDDFQILDLYELCKHLKALRRTVVDEALLRRLVQFWEQ